ncbi:hypothetical protein ACU686_13600 [Yinghuangia aomiensis]
MTADQARQLLQKQYGISEIIGVDGAQWTRRPNSSRSATRSHACRSATAPHSAAAAWSASTSRTPRPRTPPWNAAAAATSSQGTGSLVFLDSVFTDGQGFVGNIDDPRPRSHFHIVRLVAFAVLHHSGGGVLTTFAGKVAELELRHLTDESQDAGNADMADFFAEAYSLRLNELQVLQWFSQALAEWMEGEEYHW